MKGVTNRKQTAQEVASFSRPYPLSVNTFTGNQMVTGNVRPTGALTVDSALVLQPNIVDATRTSSNCNLIGGRPNNSVIKGATGATIGGGGGISNRKIESGLGLLLGFCWSSRHIRSFMRFLNPNLRIPAVFLRMLSPMLLLAVLAWRVLTAPAVIDVSFVAPRDFPVGGSASIAIGDFNGDGKPDLATADLSSNDVSVLINKGDGTYLPAVSYSVGRAGRGWRPRL